MPAEARGRAYGAYNFLIGMAALPAGLLTGSLWQAYGAVAALSLGAALSVVSCALLLAWARQGGPHERTVDLRT